ncbi:MAG TPA: hypothetical protein VNZ68_00920 [Rhodocyclaceae bacterium]|nr:hypothetical protein [Rhodocyclaceae bacterium]
MPRRKPSPPPSVRLRQTIASYAARLMAEEGIDDYGFAKRKAARALGASESEALPGNDEVEAELRTYQALFQEEEHPERLRELRSTALEVMDLLAPYRPYLTGAVLDGTAGRYAEIELELFADSSKEVEIDLLSRDISYENMAIRNNQPHSPESRLRLDWDETPIILSVFPISAERHLKRNPHTGRSPGRATQSAVAALLTAAP